MEQTPYWASSNRSLNFGCLDHKMDTPKPNLEEVCEKFKIS